MIFCYRRQSDQKTVYQALCLEAFGVVGWLQEKKEIHKTNARLRAHHHVLEPDLSYFSAKVIVTD